jgi:hypothetical protein
MANPPKNIYKINLKYSRKEVVSKCVVLGVPKEHVEEGGEDRRVQPVDRGHSADLRVCYSFKNNIYLKKACKKGRSIKDEAKQIRAKNVRNN